MEPIKNLEELRMVLGRCIADIQNKEATDFERRITFERADYTSKIAKQFNNSAKLVLNSDQLENRHDRIDDWIGEKK